MRIRIEPRSRKLIKRLAVNADSEASISVSDDDASVTLSGEGPWRVTADVIVVVRGGVIRKPVELNLMGQADMVLSAATFPARLVASPAD